MIEPTKICANGTPGCSLDNGEMYPVRNACTAPRVPDSIYCDHCRKEAGGYVPQLVELHRLS